jgi:hypothetical protein
MNAIKAVEFFNSHEINMIDSSICRTKSALKKERKKKLWHATPTNSVHMTDSSIC